MWRSKKFILVATLIAVMLSGSVLGISCSSTGGKNEQLPGTSQNVGSPGGMPSGAGLSSDVLAKVAEILGIEQQTLEDAFAQAQSEMPGGPTGTPPGNSSSEQQ